MCVLLFLSNIARRVLFFDAVQFTDLDRVVKPDELPRDGAALAHPALHYWLGAGTRAAFVGP